MHSAQYLALLGLAGLAASAPATCGFGFGIIKNGKKETNTHRCVPRTDGKWTFTMETTLLEVPNPGQPTGTFEETIDFTLYDPHCIVKGGWNRPSCGVPYTLNAAALTKTLVVNWMFADVGSPGMGITYGGQKLTTTCNKSSDSGGLRAISDCQVHFAR